MIKSVTTVQFRILRRCAQGLRVWESGVARAALLSELQTLRQLGLVAFDDAHGHLLTPSGEAFLSRFDALSLKRRAGG